MSDENNMHAIEITNWGAPQNLEYVRRSKPIPLPTEILVRVRAIGVNPVDAFTRAGNAYMRALSLPHIPGWDLAGTVESVGYGVTRFKAGDDVYGMPWFPRAGSAYAEYVTAPSRHFAKKPHNMTFEEAAALPLVGLTSWQMLSEVAKARKGSRILVNGGAGGVGHIAIQIAKSMGAYVISTARSEKHSFLKSLGADEVVDYTQVVVEDVVRDVDIVLELVGGDICLRMLKTLKPGGQLISAQAAWASGLMSEANRLGVRASWYLVEPDGAGLEQLSQLVEAHKLKVHVEQTLPLKEARRAHEIIAQRRTLGKIVLVP